MKAVSIISSLFLTACVTINIYFPAAAAEQVADEIIKEIQSEEGAHRDTNVTVPDQSQSNELQLVLYQWLDSALNIVISPAEAAADLSVESAEIRQLRAQMRTRFAALKPFYSNGLIAIKADGFIAARGNIPLKDRNKVNKLVAAENTNRQRLYQAIANANGHPEWLAQIKSTFATRWIRHAKAGWWYQTSNGNWKQK